MIVAVFLGGISPERNISLLSGRAIVKGLRGQGHTVKAIDPSRGADGLLTDKDLEQASAAEVSLRDIASFRPEALVECVMSPLLDGVDIVFIALHGRYGEDGYVQSLLDLRGVRYTGSGMLASSVAMDKAMTKMLFQVGGIPTAFWVVVHPEDADNLDMIDEIRRELSGKIVVKPNDQGSTVGLSIVDANDVEAVRAAIREAAQFTKTILIERYIAGRELTVTVLGDEALPVIEIEPHVGIYDYENKYTKGKTEYHCPAELTEEVRDHVMSLAVTAHHILGCRAYSRVDFRLNDENIPVCLEVNTSPGFTELSLVPMSAREAGIEFGPLCDEIIRLSLED